MTRREIFISGFLASIFGAIAATLAGLAISISWPLWICVTAGSLLASAIGWLGLSRHYH